MMTLKTHKHPLEIYFSSLIIIVIHLFFLEKNTTSLNTDWWQVVKGGEENKWKEIVNIIFWQFSNSPVWSITHVLEKLWVGNISVLKIIQTWMHLHSMIVFSRFFPSFRIPILLLFINPFIFQLFNISSPEFISFFIIIIFIQMLRNKAYNKLLIVMALLSIVNIKFHFLLILISVLLIGVFSKRIGFTLNKYVFIFSLGLVLIIPAKNYIAHNSFGYSFWLKANVASNYEISPDNIDPKYHYFTYKIDSSRFYKTHNTYISPSLNKLNSYEYRDFLKSESWKNLFAKIGNNGLKKNIYVLTRNIYIYFQTPNQYPLYFNSFYDYFDIIRLDITNKKLVLIPLLYAQKNKKELYEPIQIGIYHIVYPLLLVCFFILLYKKKATTELKIVAAIILYFFFLVVLIDGKESNRMRAGIEPLFYYLFFACLQLIALKIRQVFIQT